MIQKILNQIENVDKSLAWIKKNKPAEYEQRFISLVRDVRRRLRILANAERYNPGVAAYGQSQVGKSYLMNCILQDNKSPFMVDTEKGEYNFVEEINPIGDGQEATGVVTRFSSYIRNPEDYSLRYPIRMRVLGVKDMIAIISDSYFNEFDDYTTLGENEIMQRCEQWKNKYSNASVSSNPVLTADDMFDLQAYFRNHINNAQVYSNKTAFFETLALLVDRIPVTDYTEIFSILWNEESEYTCLFNKALDTIQRLGFEEHVYLPIESVLHHGTKEDTIMSVSCLKLLLTPEEAQYKTEAYKKAGGDEMMKLDTFTKSELCTVCSEVVIKIGERFLVSSGEYDTSMMTSGSKLPETKVEVNVLEKTDLLDFPGARARGGMSLIQIKNHENLMYSVLRGKVAYLFNKYNEEKIINILLFCHHHKNVESPNMWQMLEEWVNEYIGRTPEERAEYIAKTKVSPLFHIGTMWNLNLQNPDNESVGKTDESIYSRWKGRFVEKLLQECFKRTEDNWVSNWTGRGVTFRNCYMLRDYKFSENIYSGWKNDGKESELVIDEDYFKRMREQFVKANDEYKLFDDPELSWDVSATRNNDGSLYILQQLNIVSAEIAEAREMQIRRELNLRCQETYSIMRDYHVSATEEELLEENIRKARQVFREMDFACNNDNYYFGHLLQALQITEKEVYNIIHKVMQSPELNSNVNDFKDYEIIRNRCKLDAYKETEDKWKALMDTYGFDSQEEAQEFLIRKHIDFDKLFTGSYKRKMNSYIIADSAYDAWRDEIRSVNFIKEFTDNESFDISVMTNLMDNMVKASESLALQDIMASAIAEYVNVVNIHTANESLLADVLASKINAFVLDFGFELRSEKDKEKARNLCEKRNLPAFKYILKELPASYDEAQLTALFNEMSTSPRALLPSFDDNYNKWIEYMFVSFVANLDVPDIDIEENKVLEKILEQLKAA